MFISSIYKQNHILHYLENGSANLCFAYQKEIFFVPAIMLLKALVDISDFDIYKRLMLQKEKNSLMEVGFKKTASHFSHQSSGYLISFLSQGCVKFMLRQLKTERLYTQQEVLAYIGNRFRVKLMLPDWYTDVECAKFLLEHCLLTHLDKNIDKFYALM